MSSQMSNNKQPETQRKSHFSIIWLFPIIALIIGGWLIWRSEDQKGEVISIQFSSGTGMTVGKTELIYKGISLGKVSDLNLAHDGQNVIAKIEVDKDASAYINAGTRFWLVEPSISMGGVSGLDTLVSGIYIGMDPGPPGSVKKLNFVALNEPPLLPDTAPGLHITLDSDELGSISVGSPVYFRQLLVGKVDSYKLGEDQKTIKINIFINKQFQHLVRKDTRFWNASGIKVSASLSGVQIQTESLMSILAGGIAFDLPAHVEEKDSPEANPDEPFKLYSDFQSAKAGIPIRVRLPSVEGFTPGETMVMYNGVRVGYIQKLDMSSDYQSVTAEILMNPNTEKLLNEKTQFWVVKPSISLAGVKGLDALIKGNFIAVNFDPSNAEPQRDFVTLSSEPLKKDDGSAVVTLTSDHQGSLNEGSPILYRDVPIGSIQKITLSKNANQVIFIVRINGQYAHLVNSSSKFWDASGVSIKAGLAQGFELKTGSMESLVIGGITVETSDTKASKGDLNFPLFSDRDKAMESGTIIDIRLPDAIGLSVGSEIKSRGVVVGKLIKLGLTSDMNGVAVQARIHEFENQITKTGTQFWVVKPEVGLAGVNNIGNVITGNYLEVLPSRSGGARSTSFQVTDAPAINDENISSKDLRITLGAMRLGSIKPGVAVTYKDVPVGKVSRVELANNAREVYVHVLIQAPYANLVRSNSKFWDASGFEVDAGIFSGVQVRYESMETVVAGAVGFATPEGSEMGALPKPNQVFTLHAEPQAEWLKWSPRIPIKK